MYIININYKYTNAYVVIIFHACCRNKRKEINFKNSNKNVIYIKINK